MSQADKGDRSEFREGWPVILGALVGAGLGNSGVPLYTIGIFAPFLAAEFGWGFGQIMAGMLIVSMGIFVMSPLVGALADRFGVRRVAIMSILLFAFSYALFAANPGNLIVYYAMWLGVAILGTGTGPIPWTRGVNSWFERHRGLALGISMVGSGLFGSLLKPYTFWAIEAFGWRGGYIAVAALPLLISLPIVLLTFRERAVDKALPDRMAAGPSVREAARSWRFWLLAFVFALLACCVAGPVSNMENILRLHGLPQTSIVSLAALIGFGVITGRLAGGWLLDRLWGPGVVFVLLSICGLACLLLALPGIGFWALALGIFLISASAGVEFDALPYLVSRYFGMRHYGAIFGALYGILNFGSGFGPLLFGWFYDLTGSYQGILIAAAIIVPLTSALLLALGPYPDIAAARQDRVPGP